MLKPLPRLRDGGDVKSVLAVPATERVATLEAVYPGRGPSMRTEESVEFHDRATADERNCVVEDRAQTRQQIVQLRIDLHRIRGCRDVEQRAVNVQKQAPERLGNTLLRHSSMPRRGCTAVVRSDDRDTANPPLGRCRATVVRLGRVVYGCNGPACSEKS